MSDDNDDEAFDRLRERLVPGQAEAQARALVSEVTAAQLREIPAGLRTRFITSLIHTRSFAREDPGDFYERYEADTLLAGMAPAYAVIYRTHEASVLVCDGSIGTYVDSTSLDDLQK